jgi:endonuclease YncB( thermonuclease family)
MLLGLALYGLDQDSGPSPPSPAPTKTEPQPQPVETKAQERAGPAGAAVNPLQSLDLDPPYLIHDGLTLAAGATTIRLAGLEGPGPKAACKNDGGHLWACGLQARAALNNETRQRRLACVAAATDTDGAVRATCSIEGEDLGRRLVAGGWAKPAGVVSNYDPAVIEGARRGKRGLWNGDWAITDPGPPADIRPEFRQSSDVPMLRPAN